MGGKDPKTDGRMIVTRHTTLERLSHYANIIFLAFLAMTGFTMYLGLPYLQYQDAYRIHIISAAAFLAINWIVTPYAAIANGRIVEYWFWLSDVRRLLGVLSNFFTGTEYPRYTIYDERRGKFRNRLHPITKLLIYLNYTALLVSTLTGVVIYSTMLTILGVNISSIVLRVFDFVSPTINMSGFGMARLLHLVAAYWFVIGTVIHIGVVQLDPKKFEHIKSMFFTGKEDLMVDPTAEIVNPINDD
ncbi:MAG TPA: cytochrome b/b6 domain-containing protein [Methanocella sp.]|nr:cytochrome b/b6 domain-containing protein [Methanocella sp.]